MNNVIVSKNYTKCEKTQRYKIYHNRKKKKPFGVRTKFSYYKDFHTTFISNRYEKTEILMNRSVYLGLSILELCKMLMYEFWYQVKPKYRVKTKLCFMDTDSFVVYIKTDDIHKIFKNIFQKMLKLHLMLQIMFKLLVRQTIA